MYSNVKHDDKFIQKLAGFIKENYKLDVISVKEATRGFYGETWAIDTAQKKYFAKLISAEYQQGKYRSSFGVMDFLINCDIDFIPSILKTVEGNLYTNFGEGVLGIFDFVEGENREDYQLEELLSRLIRIYQIYPKGIKIPADDYGNHDIEFYEKSIEKLQVSKTIVYKKTYGIIVQNKAFLDECMKHLKWITSRLNNKDIRRFITHGDAGGNVIIDEDRFWIIDWDDPVLATIERDIWFFAPYVDIKRMMNKLLVQNCIEYKISDELIAYYTYKSLFYYLNECFRALYELKSEQDKESMVAYIDGTINGWIRKQIEYADDVVIALKKTTQE